MPYKGKLSWERKPAHVIDLDRVNQYGNTNNEWRQEKTALSQLNVDLLQCGLGIQEQPDGMVT